MTDLPRRAMIGGSALAALASAAPAPGGPRRSTLEGYPSTPLDSVPDRRALALLADPVANRIVYLAERGRAGLFRCVPGPAPAGDPLQGLFVPAASAPYHYAREWDGTHGQPEWFGARPGEAEADCADAIEQCFAHCPVTELGQVDYVVRRTVRLERSFRSVVGRGRWAQTAGQGSRIVLSARAADAGSADVMLVGFRTNPGSNEAALRECHLRDFTVVREAPCVPHPSGDPARYPAGLRASFVFHCSFGGIVSLESSVGFYIGGTVYTKFDDCLTRRQKPGTTRAGDRAIGFYLDGRISFGYAGGNASIYMDRCASADQSDQHVDPVGLLAVGAFVDSFIDRYESARVATGMAFAVAGQRGYSQTIDLHVRNAVLDGCGVGIDLDLDATSSATVEIVDPYIAGGGGAGARGIAIHDGAGLVTIVGGQIHGSFGGGSLYLHRTRGVTVTGTKITNGSRPVVVGEASGLVLEPQINNYGYTAPAFAIDCEHLARSIVRPVVVGAAAPAFRGGIALGARSDHNHVDPSGIDPACFTVADPRFKLWFGGADARAGGGRAAFEANGNRVSGVLD